MGNSGSFKKGHRCSKQSEAKRIKSLKKAWQTRSDRHGMMGTKFHNTWRSMTTRCRGTAGEDSKKKYRDKGITVCERWLDFKNFYHDMYPTYIEGLTIDRIENDKGYHKENCRWATPTQQSNNRTNNTRIEYNGESLTMREWSDKIGVPFTALRNRYYKQYLKGLITIEYLFRIKDEKELMK